MFLFFSSSYSVPKDGRKENKSLFPFLLLLFIYICMRKKKEQKRERRRFTWPDDGVATHPDRESLWSLPSSHLHPHSKRTEEAASPTGCTRRSYIRMLCTYIYICVCVYIYCTAGCFFIIKTDLGGPYIHSSGLLSLSPSCSSDLPSFFFLRLTQPRVSFGLSLSFSGFIP